MTTKILYESKDGTYMTTNREELEQYEKSLPKKKETIELTEADKMMVRFFQYMKTTIKNNEV